MKNLIHPESVSVVVTSTICKQEITLKRSDNTLVNLFLASYSDNYLINPLTIITFSSSEVTLHLQRKLNIAGLFLIAFLEKDKESDDYRTFVALLLGTYTIGVSHNKYDAKTQRGINHLIKASPISFASNTIKIVKEFTCTRNNFRHSTYSLDIANPLLLTDRIKDFLSQNMNVLKTIENFTDLPGFDEAFADTDLGSVEAAIFWREIAKVIILAPTANNHSTDYPLMFDKVEHLLKLMKRPIATNTRCLENLQETLKVMLGELAVVDHTNQKKREEAILVEAIQACEAYSENQDSLGTLETLKTTLKKTQILAHPDKRQVVFSDPLIINYREQMEFFKDNFSSSNTTGAPSI